jgi:hypothetical protein
MVVSEDAEAIFGTLPLRVIDTTTCISIVCLSTPQMQYLTSRVGQLYSVAERVSLRNRDR